MNDVDRWFDECAHPLDAAVHRTRAIVLGADSRVTESIKGKTPTFGDKGNIVSFKSPPRTWSVCCFIAARRSPGEHSRLEGDGKLPRTMRFADLGAVEAGRPELEAVIRAWCTWEE